MRTQENEPFVISRDTKAVIVPAGVEVKLKTGQSGFITQALGGSFTLYIEGNLFRLAGEDADAGEDDAGLTPRTRTPGRDTGPAAAPAGRRRLAAAAS